MRDDLLSQALAALQGSDASPYTIKVGGVERRPPILSSTPVWSPTPSRSLFGHSFRCFGIRRTLHGKAGNFSSGCLAFDSL
ncbi:hypothetical protein CFBP7900_28580 [Xanthomonas hortorum pv. carotae]|uniref:Uncharacterized protein n=1 Tax=Xanthomonas hortorum pv. carotae TaxID=487904 RepID=A0A6V7EYS6_9XANT|nr:hypothetical protein CFBP7900_28580 [Xanthomonas hortorum pv. carotae]CAD0356520.1 hypothetical protein CFBP7900_28580 [Xanthomonas hortorum pv. carotae]